MTGGQQKMESKSLGKRKSKGPDIIFEISDDDMSPEHPDPDSDTNEPEAKISKKAPSIEAKDNLQIGKEISLVLDDFIERTYYNEQETKVADVKTVDEVSQKTLEEGELEEVDSTIQNNLCADSCIVIQFRDTQIASLYKKKFLKFLENFIELDTVDSGELTIKINKDNVFDPNEWEVLDETYSANILVDELEEPTVLPKVDTPRKKNRKKKMKKEKELFTLDTTPSNNQNHKQFLKYASKFQIDDIEEVEEIKERVSTNMCFNCDGNHAIKDCTIPRDYMKINMARQKFKTQKQTTRYHVEEDQKYSHLVPGKISDKLREALGLHKNGIPQHVYMMRLYGYPPGWLEEAKLVYSNLVMFGTDQQDAQSDSKKHCLDPEKIIEYPGFNVPLEKGMKDEYRHYNAPPYSGKFSKEKMMEFFEKQRRKEQDDSTPCDMDLDKTNEEISDEDVENLNKNANTPAISHDIKKSEVDVPSPSIEDLQKKQEKLLSALEDSSSTNSDSKPAERNSRDGASIGEEADIPTSEEPKDANLVSPVLDEVNSIKTSTFGTPIIRSNSQYSHLPNPDNFMKDVSPVINFENLPNSTGKYEQMTGLLQKVRSQLKGIHGCKS